MLPILFYLYPEIDTFVVRFLFKTMYIALLHLRLIQLFDIVGYTLQLYLKRYFTIQEFAQSLNGRVTIAKRINLTLRKQISLTCNQSFTSQSYCCRINTFEHSA